MWRGRPRPPGPRGARLAGPVADRTAIHEKVLKVMETVPRHAFVPDELRDYAYRDRPLPIGHGQTISQPYIVALMTDLLDLDGDEVALELTVAQAEERLLRHEVPFARVRRLADLPEDEQIQHNQMFRELNPPAAGPLRDARPAPRFTGTPAEPGGPAPGVGEHTRHILEEIGMGANTEKLFERGIVS